MTTLCEQSVGKSMTFSECNGKLLCMYLDYSITLLIHLLVPSHSPSEGFLSAVDMWLLGCFFTGAVHTLFMPRADFPVRWSTCAEKKIVQKKFVVPLSYWSPYRTAGIFLRAKFSENNDPLYYGKFAQVKVSLKQIFEIHLLTLTKRKVT